MKLLPSSWMPDLATLLPADPTHAHAPQIAMWLTAAYLVVITLRSLVHLFAPDGGAASIATVDTKVAGGANVIAMFGQWGAVQLLLAALLWVLWARYPGLLPLILCVLLAEPFLRALSGRLKPLQTRRTAPGARLNWVVAPILAAVLYLALCPAG